VKDAAHPAEIQKVLDEYEDLFQEPNTLPPTIPFDHSIHLLPGAPPVNIRSYKYSLAQKDEIEKQLQGSCKVESSSQAAIHMLPQFCW
jgi:hypothetical protein